MINAKRMLLFLPLYVVGAVTVDVWFDSASPPGSKSVPTWMTVGFIVSAVFVAGVVLWYLSRRAAGKVPQQRQHVYTALFIAIIVSGFVADALKGAAWLLLGGHPWWVLVPIYTLGYAACWAVLMLMVNRLERRTDDRSNSPRA
ncbi:hypothetical protein [Mycobacterium malmoense]|nr:hypothetical protein [Mycobacterium malmoense]